MIWAVLWIDHNGEGAHEVYGQWTAARDALAGFIDQVNPRNTEVTFKLLLKDARPDQPFHATDGVYSFALEAI